MLHVIVCEVKARFLLGMVEQLSVPMLLDTSCTDKSLKSIFPGKRKMVFCNSSTVLILMVYDGDINNRNSQTQQHALLKLQRLS